MVPVVDSVARLVAAQHHARWGINAVDREVFGTGDPAEIAAILDRFCQREVGTGIGTALFYGASAGCVLGLRLADGTEVVVKAYQERWRAPFLQAVQAVQSHMADPRHPVRTAGPRAGAGGARAPAPGDRRVAPARSGPAPVRVGGGAPSVRRRPGPPDRRRPVSCVPSAALAPLADHPLRRVDSGLYGEPHSPLFDFAATAEGAEWMDALATRTAAGRDADERPPVIAHTDWSARNVRLDDDGLLAVYDWDSVALVPESTAIGQAAVDLVGDGRPRRDGVPDAAPTSSASWPTTRRRPAAGSTTCSGAAAAAAAVYALAYTARCEHSLDAKGMARPTSTPPGTGWRRPASACWTWRWARALSDRDGVCPRTGRGAATRVSLALSRWAGRPGGPLLRRRRPRPRGRRGSRPSAP